MLSGLINGLDNSETSKRSIRSLAEVIPREGLLGPKDIQRLIASDSNAGDCIIHWRQSKTPWSIRSSDAF